ncbi:Uncharacterised protein [Candidatus Tiddalikarchaeum anstoanum]|nr:Uncharacterised protein [Candidatus Tiddalikarchaeum anstoanum]
MDLKQKLANIDETYHGFLELIKQISDSLKESYENNASSFNELTTYIAELKEKIKPAFQKYSKTLKEIDGIKEDFNQLKPLYEKLPSIIEQTIMLKVKISNLNLPGADEIGELEKLTLSMKKIEETACKVEEFFIGGNNLFKVSEKLSSLYSTLQEKQKILDQLDTALSGSISGESVLKLSKKIESLEVLNADSKNYKNLTEDSLLNFIKGTKKMSTQIRWLKNEFGDETKIFEILETLKNKGLVDYSHLNNIMYVHGKKEDNQVDSEKESADAKTESLDSKQGTVTPPAKEDIIKFAIQTIILSGKSVGYKSISDYFNYGTDSLVDSLISDNVLTYHTRSIPFSDEKLSEEEAKIKERLSMDANFSKENVFKTIGTVSKQGSALFRAVYTELKAGNDFDKALIGYQIRQLAKEDMLVVDKNIVRVKNKDMTQNTALDNQAGQEETVKK